MNFEDQRDQRATPTTEPVSHTAGQTDATLAGKCTVQTNWTAHTWSHQACCWSTACMLNRANNKLQELMQLLYLLGRDPSIPQGVRHHVTVAQSEITLLTHLLHAGQPASAENV